MKVYAILESSGNDTEEEKIVAIFSSSEEKDGFMDKYPYYYEIEMELDSWNNFDRYAALCYKVVMHLKTGSISYVFHEDKKETHEDWLQDTYLVRNEWIHFNISTFNTTQAKRIALERRSILINNPEMMKQLKNFD